MSYRGTNPNPNPHPHPNPNPHPHPNPNPNPNPNQVSLEEDDLPSLYAIAREVVRAHDEAAEAAAAEEEADDNAPARPAQPPPRAAPPRSSTVWWQQLGDDDEDDDGRAGVRALESWVATKHLGRARLCLLKGQVNEAISALEQLRTDFIMFARSAAP